MNYGGINVADGEHVILRNNVASNCGVQGMGSGGTSHLLFENNLLDDNNYKGVSPWSEGGAIKTGFWGTHIVIRGNVARNNHNHGLWIDYGGPDCVIENNFVFNAVAGAILNEVTPNPEQSQFPDGTLCGEKEPKADAVRRFQQRGTIIRNNVLVGTRAPGGGGINISSSSDGRIYNNIVAANVGGGLNHPSPCSVRFHIDVQNRTLRLDTHVYGVGLSADVTRLVEPGKWFNVVLQWGPESGNRTEFVLLVDGKPVATKVDSRRPASPGVLLRMGVPGNGGQPWVGAMDELEVWNSRLEAEELARPTLAAGQ